MILPPKVPKNVGNGPYNDGEWFQGRRWSECSVAGAFEEAWQMVAISLRVTRFPMSAAPVEKLCRTLRQP
jgi:hypothetical protein